MEEYRDLYLTVDVFRSLLDEPEFDKFEAGIVLQAYLPDSFSVLQSLTQWAQQRKQRTGTGIKIRLVKGANLAMEQVEASLRDWPQAPYETKLQVDANFKRMLEFACRPENAAAVRIGVGSHNLFDIAYALLLRERRGVQDRVEFEMLEGMANAQALEVRDRSGGCLVYAPVVLDAEFEAAIAYLVRRLDENTAPGSFLGALFSLKEGSPDWIEQRDAFLEACRLSQDPQLQDFPNRQQNRLTENISVQGAEFQNVPDTDFSIPNNRTWAKQIIENWRDRKIEPVPIQVGGEFKLENMTGKGRDPSRPGSRSVSDSRRPTNQTSKRRCKPRSRPASDWDAAGMEHRGHDSAAGRGRISHSNVATRSARCCWTQVRISRKPTSKSAKRSTLPTTIPMVWTILVGTMAPMAKRSGSSS